jgi:hypothetical protein
MWCRRRSTLIAVAWAALLVCPIAVGCGGSSGTGSSSTVARSSHLPGIKGERPGREAASDLRLSVADCAALATALGHQTDAHLRRQSDPSPPLSRCRLSGAGVEVNVYLDSSYAAHQRYENRVVEQAQFGAPDTTKLPHPVARVGSGAGSANWVPALRSLFAVRGNRWLTVAYAVDGLSNSSSRRDAARLARVAFRLSSH